MTFDELNEIAKYDERYVEKKMGMISLQIPPDLANGDYICVDRDGNRRESVRPIKVHRLYLGTGKDSDTYGIMVGIIEYDGSFYRFHYCVCNKKTQGVYKMKFVKGLEVKRKDGVPYIEVKKEGFGRQAFSYVKNHMDLIQYQNGSYELSLLSGRIESYCYNEKNCYELVHGVGQPVHGVRPVETRRGMHTDEWIAGETKEDIETNFGFPLKQDQYTLPMIKLTFGEEYIPVPQNRMVYLLLTGMDGKAPLKLYVYGSWCYTAAGELGISDEDVKKTMENGRIPDGTGSEAEKAIFRWIEKKIQTDGPYVVLGKALNSGYMWEADPWYVDIDEPYEGVIGEKQEWEKE